jgi:hypothetical protein
MLYQVLCLNTLARYEVSQSVRIGCIKEIIGKIVALNSSSYTKTREKREVSGALGIE